MKEVASSACVLNSYAHGRYMEAYMLAMAPMRGGLSSVLLYRLGSLLFSVLLLLSRIARVPPPGPHYECL